MAIPIYTVLPYCVIHYNAGAGYKEATLKKHGNNGLAILHWTFFFVGSITQYGSTVYIGMAMGGSAL